MVLSHPETGASLRCGKVLCIGRNYARHAAEMNASIPSEPVVFLKPTTALVKPPGRVVMPNQTAEVHHEIELVAMIGHPGKNIPYDDGLEYVAGYAVGLDMTARDLQSIAKKKGRPWSVAKGFDTFAPIGSFVPASQVEDVQDLTLQLKVNGETKQLGSTADMIFDVGTLVEWCSEIFTLEPGDLLFTGTPEGVGPVGYGDRLQATCSQLPPLDICVT